MEADKSPFNLKIRGLELCSLATEGTQESVVSKNRTEPLDLLIR